jgi:hypothetical protein
MIVVYRFVLVAALDRADHRIRRIRAERDRRVLLRAAQIPVDRLANDRGDWVAAAARPMPQLAKRLFREPEIGGDVARHGDTTISRYRGAVNAI